MAQWVIVSAAKSNGLSFILKTYMVEGDNKFSDLQMNAGVHTYPNTHTHTINI